MRQYSLRAGLTKPVLFKHMHVRGSTLNQYAQDAARKGSVYIDHATKVRAPPSPALTSGRLNLERLSARGDYLQGLLQGCPSC